MELFEVFNQNGEPINKVVQRGNKLGPNEFFLVVHVWICNQKGEFLIQQRAKKSDPTPYQWATTTGLPKVNEALEDAARRETYEELGLDIDRSKFEKLREITTIDSKYRTITHVFLVSINDQNLVLNLDKSEVKSTRFEPLSNIITMVNNGDFWDYRVLLADPKYFDFLERR